MTRPVLPRSMAKATGEVGFLLALWLGAALCVAAWTGAASLARAEEPDAAPRVALQIHFVEELSFGRVVSEFGRGGAVVIDPDSNRKRLQGGAVDLSGPYGRAVLRVTGEPRARFVITLPPEVKLTGKGGGAVLTDITASPTLVGQLGPDGSAMIYLGATLRMRPGQPAGAYNGKFDIFVDYQ